MMYPVYLQKSKYLCLKQRKWVKTGGVLIYYGKDEDPYQTVSEWWNTKGNSYKAPSKAYFNCWVFILLEMISNIQ